MVKAKTTQRILVLDNSALISMLSPTFLDSYRYSIDMFEKLILPQPGKLKPVVDRIYIPDHVFYEFTGILPFSIPAMQKRFASVADDPKALEAAIEFYVAASPRSSINVRNRDTIKTELRTLLRFIAKYPYALGYDTQSAQWQNRSETAQHYIGRLVAEHSVLGGVSVQPPDNYRPTIGDAMEAVGQEFNVDRLRVHAGQLYMMGFYDEDDYDDRMGRNPPSVEKPRFITVLDFAKHLQEKKGWISPEERTALKEARDVQLKEVQTSLRKATKGRGITQAEVSGRLAAARGDASYLTIGFLKQFPQFFHRYESRSTNVMNPTSYLQGRYGTGSEVVTESIRPCRLLMEHYFFGNLIPLKARYDVARFLGFDLGGADGTADARSLDKMLDRQGFYERAPTVGEIRNLYAHLLEKSKTSTAYNATSLRTLKAFIDQMPKALMHYQEEFDRACKNPRSTEASVAEDMPIPTTGLPYERVFSEAVVDGVISFNEFMEIAQRSGALTDAGRFDNRRLGTSGGDIMVSWDNSGGGERSTVWVRQSDKPNPQKNDHGGSFVSRSGLTKLRYPNGVGESLPPDNARYWRMSAEELLARCRNNMEYNGEKDRLDRAFSAMLYRGVTHSASRVHSIAADVLGNERLTQMEKDFTNRHIRYWANYLPPYTNPLASLYIARRIARKNLGEIATAGIATQLCRDNPDAQIWIVNHDSDLYPDDTGIHFSEQVWRTQSSKNTLIKRVESEMGEYNQEGRLQFMRTDQLLDTICLLSDRNKPAATLKEGVVEPYPNMRIKKKVTNELDVNWGWNNEWRDRIHRPINDVQKRYR